MTTRPTRESPEWLKMLMIADGICNAILGWTRSASGGGVAVEKMRNIS